RRVIFATGRAAWMRPRLLWMLIICLSLFFFFKQKPAYEIGLGIPADRSSDLGIPAEPTLFRYTQDAFSRSGWLWPVDAKGEPLRSEERRVGKECRSRWWRDH